MSFNEWKKYKLGAIATFYNGRAYKNEEFKSSRTPIVRIQNLTGEGKTVYSDLDLEKNKYIEYGDLIYAWSATFGPYLWKKGKSIYHYHIWKIECDNRYLDKNFCYYKLKDISDALKEGGNGTLFVHITKSFIENFEVIIPSIDVQRRIAAILTSIDDRIEINNQINQTLEKIAQAQYKEMCFPKSDELPKGWRVAKLKEICDVNKNTLNKKIDVLEWIDYIEISEVSKGVIGKVANYRMGEEPSRAKRKLRHGDTVLSTVRPDRGSYFLAIHPSQTDIASTGFAVFSPRSSG